MDYSGTQPDFLRIVELWWSGGYEADAFYAETAFAANVIIGTNPPYTLSDFLAMYPKFFGPSTAITVTLTANSNQMAVTSTGFTPAVGQFLTCSGIPDGTIVTGVDGSTVTLSNPAASSGTGVAANVYASPFLPLFIIQTYINLARASLMKARYFDTWFMAMGLFIAHYCTMWLSTETGPNSTAAQVAASGYETGIALSQSAGDVSYSAQLPSGWEEWGSWSFTRYGQLFMELARTAGSGPMYIH